jgi:SAM-dependent methyltransferase
VAIGATPLDEFEKKMLTPGARYGLLVECLTLAPPSGGCIAEIGCGGGEALLILSRRFAFTRVVGIDIATTISTGAADQVLFLNSDLNDRWPFEDGEVDHLVAMMVIEHLFDPFHAFREIERCLSREGAAYINLPLVTSWRNRIRLLLGAIPETSDRYESWFERGEWDGNHLHYFSLHSIRDLARYCGLSVTHISGVGALYKLKTLWPQFLAGEVTVRLCHDSDRKGTTAQ